MSRAGIDKRPAEVSAMFDQVAGRYDLLNDVLSLGQDRLWRRAVGRAVKARAGERVLDLAAGTGTSSQVFAAAGALCVACDFSLGMLKVGMRRIRRRRASGAADPSGAGPTVAGVSPAIAAAAGVSPRIPAAGQVSFVAGDALRLPFGDGFFDVVTICFGLRNVANPDVALAEMLRVTRPGGRLVICEFGHLPWPRLNALYGRYLSVVLPAVARRLSPAPDAYKYLAESIRDWPAAPELARRMGLAGWSAVRWRNLTLGVVTLHAARRPE